jgi:hypothetical protein
VVVWGLAFGLWDLELRKQGGQRDSKPMERFRGSARLMTFLVGKMRVNHQQSQIGYCSNRARLRNSRVRICPKCLARDDSCDEKAQNPRIALFSGNQVIASNNDWKTNSNAADITGAGYNPSDDREAVLFVTLEPGPYTAIVSSEDFSEGVGLVEVYDD